jgi:hypothetical protein
MATVDMATGMFWFRNEYISHPTQTTVGQFTNAGCAGDPIRTQPTE